MPKPGGSIDADRPSSDRRRGCSRSGPVVERRRRRGPTAGSRERGRNPPGGCAEEAPVVFDRLVLVGDSLAEATAPVIRYATPGKEFVRKFFGGTAPCDWIDDDLEATPTTVVVITFTGNNMTPCMLDETRAHR